MFSLRLPLFPLLFSNDNYYTLESGILILAPILRIMNRILISADEWKLEPG